MTREEMNAVSMTLSTAGSTPVIMTISHKGIWVDPNIEVNEAAQRVIEALEVHFQHSWKVARDEALEEAAKVAEFRIGCDEWSADTNSGYECASREIAAAIRALRNAE